MEKTKLKRRMALLIMSFFMLCSFGTEYSFAQKTVTGSVISEDDNAPLPGVNILIKGTTEGTITDLDGNYTINVSSDDAVLIFSFMGYDTQEVTVGEQTSIDITLKPSAESLDEVIVVGYGTQVKANLTGAVTSVDLDNIEGKPAANTASLLQGQMTGVTVSGFNNQPGQDDPQILIRGVGTLNAGSSPLVIVDGVESSMSQIPASDIQSISVLKDAASASIYGVRAANGVIVVTTKRGKSNKPTIQFNHSYAWQQALVKPSLVNSWEQATILNLDAEERGIVGPYTQEQIDLMRAGTDPDQWANTNWFDEMYRTAGMSNTYFSISGASEKVRYMVSANLLDQDGIMINTGAKRYNFRSNIDIDVSDRIKIGINLSGNKRDITETLNSASATNSDQDLNYIIRRFASPMVPVKYSSGDWGQVDGLFYIPGGAAGQIKNPVQYANMGENITTRYNLTGKLYAEAEIFKNFHYKPSFSYVYGTSLRSKYTPTWETFDKDGNPLNSNTHNKLENKHMTSGKYLVENLLTYKLSLADHKFDFLAGQSAQLYRIDNFRAYVEDFPNNSILELDAGINNKDVGGNAKELALASYFGRFNYNYANKYLLEFNYRYDGTSRMNEDKRWGGFPSFSAGWIATNENFLKDLGPVSFIKLRGSWGELGNQNIGDSYYPYAQTLATGQNYLWDGSIAPGVAINSLANPGISWEKTTITDFGIDLNLFNDKIQITADWFDKTSSDILVRLPIPATVGNVSAPFQNVGEVKNQGWEVSVKAFHKFGPVNVYGGVNLSKVTNEVIDYGELEVISNNRITKEGAPIQSYYAYIAEGYYQTQDEIDNAPDQPGDVLRVGDIKLKDISGPDGVPDGQVDATYDRTIIGNPFPDLQYSFNLGASFKGIDFYAFFQGIQGIDRYYWMNTETNGTFTEDALDYWTEDNPNATVPRWGNTTANGAYSTFYLKDASYLRLKNLELGYTLPKSLTSKIKIEKARIYLSGMNLLTWTKDDIKDYDPEKLTNDDRNRGYPSTKVFSIGVNITL